MGQVSTSPVNEGQTTALSGMKRHDLLRYLGPAFVASVAYIDPGNFAANIQGGSQFGYRLLWVLLWSNIMAILVQYLSAKLGIVTGLSLPQNCRKHFSRRNTILLWIAAEVSAIATDLAEFLGAAIGLYLLFGTPMMERMLGRSGSLLAAAVVAAMIVFAILALQVAGVPVVRGRHYRVCRDHWRLLRDRGLPRASGVADDGVSYAGADARRQQPEGVSRQHLHGGGDAGSDGDAACGVSALGAGAAAVERACRKRRPAPARRRGCAAVGPDSLPEVRADRYLHRDERGVADQLGDDRRCGAVAGACGA